jgi:4-amino-4-deoxy-L-arabinose transferase-like glycosyltransferase
LTPNPDKPTSRHGPWAVLVLALLVGLAFQGTRHLFDPDEGRYTNVAHQMIQLDDWMVPHLDPDRPHFTKPPMTYWAVAASFSLLGSNEWTARLPNALAFALTAALVFGLARRMRLADPFLTAGIWITMWAPIVGANVVTTDTLLALFETLAVYGFVLSGLLEPGSRPWRSGLRLMWLGFGLAFLTKGPPGLLPLAAIVGFVAWRRRADLPRLLDPVGLALFALSGLSWYLLLVWRSPDLLDYFLVRETVGRVATGEHHRNAGWLGWLAVYPPTFLVGALPWAGVAAATWRARRRSGEVGAMPPDCRRFLLLWFAIPLSIFVLSQSRLPLYVLPLFVPLALAMAASLDAWAAQGRRRAVTLGIAVALAICLKGGGSLWHPYEDGHKVASDLRQHADLSQVDAIDFVDMPARYALKHYTGIDVRQVESQPGAAGDEGYARASPLCDELSGSERLLLFVPARRFDEILPRIRGCREGVERLASFDKWVLLRSLPAGAPAG